MIHEDLQEFAEAVTAKSTSLTQGEPEEQLRAPFEAFMSAAGRVLGWPDIVSTGETQLPDRLGRPDYAIHLRGALVGYVELKAPGVGVAKSALRGRNREQFKRFSAIPNLLYANGNEWALYRDGQLTGRVVRLAGDVASDGAAAALPKDADALADLLRGFLSWEPFIPTGRRGKIDLKGFAAMLAPLTAMLRDEVMDALGDEDSPLNDLARDWRSLLFPDASNKQFADGYAQTVTFALLLGRSEGADPLSLETAEKALDVQHNLLSRALRVLTDGKAREEITASLDLLIRVIGAVAPATFTGPEDPWLNFYEDFLAEYDPVLRKDAGAYYTPVEVVRCQVRLVDDLLVNRLGRKLGFAHEDVVTLDPATGTGTYLLGIIEHALERVARQEGKGATAGQATVLAKNLHGFERMVGPYAVTELRVSRALRDAGAELPEDGTHIYLTDTLESPNAVPSELPLFLRPIAEQHAKALRVKKKVPVIVCIGNPPYDRHDAVDVEDDKDDLTRFGGWVRFGDRLEDDIARVTGGRAQKTRNVAIRLEMRQRLSILRDFREPAKNAGHGNHLKNLYNLYVYFWRWALWKVFEQEGGNRPGIVSFITASSYLDGDAFCGMREHMRRHCDEIWIIDLGGEGRGTRQTENVFAIQTPVAITVAVRSRKPDQERPAKVQHARIEGRRDQKLAALDAVHSFAALAWEQCPDGWQTPFRPASNGSYFDHPLLTDLMPWQQSGVQVKRTWPICHEQETLKRRWRSLLDSPNRGMLIKETRDKKAASSYIDLLNPEVNLPPITSLPIRSPCQPLERYAYRSFDRQYLILDNRIADYLRPSLWLTRGPRQLYLSTLLSSSLGAGPALVCSAAVPDLDHFRGSYGAKHTLPLFRSADASELNILPGLLEKLRRLYKRETVTPEDFAAYVYGLLAQPAFTARFEKELETRQLRVPLTRDGKLFERVRQVGTELLWLHTYGERFVPEGQRPGEVPSGAARCVRPVPGDAARYPEEFRYNEETRTLFVGGGEFAPVERDVYEFEVSGLKPVQSWLKYRMKDGAGKKSSPLDDIRPERWTAQFTTELLELLWVLEATLAIYPRQRTLLEEVLAGECIAAADLPEVPAEMRKPPKVETLKPKDDLFSKSPEVD